MITLSVLFAALLLSSIALSRTGWSNVLSAARNELVFADRNKAYGAYILRQEHHRTMIWAFFVAIGLLAPIALVPKFFQPELIAVPSTITPDGVIFELMDLLDPPALMKETVDRTETLPTNTDPETSSVLTAVDSASAAVIDTTNTLTTKDALGDSAATGPSTSNNGSTKDTSSATSGTGTDTKPIDVWAADTKPEYPGGERAMYSYLEKNINYPETARRGNISGRVVISFVVEKDGTVADAKVVMSVSPMIDAEALRVVRKMVKWNPGKFKGDNVAVRFMLPIVF